MTKLAELKAARYAAYVAARDEYYKELEKQNELAN